MRAILGLISKSIMLVIIGVFIYEVPYLYHQARYIIKPFDSYQVSDRDNGILDTGSSRIIKPVSTQFGIIVPKIGINETVHEDGFQHEKGVYHLSSSNKPGSKSEVIIKTFYSDTELINRVNSVYPLMGKLIPEDEIFIYYNDKKHLYLVKKIKKVPTSAYSTGIEREYDNSLRIDINWPPGLYSQKLLIYATLVD